MTQPIVTKRYSASWIEWHRRLWLVGSLKRGCIIIKNFLYEKKFLYEKSIVYSGIMLRIFSRAVQRVAWKTRLVLHSDHHWWKIICQRVAWKTRLRFAFRSPMVIRMRTEILNGIKKLPFYGSFQISCEKKPRVIVSWFRLGFRFAFRRAKWLYVWVVQLFLGLRCFWASVCIPPSET